MAIGYGAGLGGVTANRKLNRIGTFKDIQNGGTAGPSMKAAPPYQPGGFGPQAQGGRGIRKYVDPIARIGAGEPHTTSGYITTPTTTATRTPYSEARTGEIPGAYGAPVGGFPQRSPWFGGGKPPEHYGSGDSRSGEPTEPAPWQPAHGEGIRPLGGREEEEAAEAEAAEARLGGGGIPDLGGLSFDREWDPLTGRYDRPLEEERDAGGLTPEELEGTAFGETPKTAGEEVGEINEDERQFNELLDKLDASQEEAQRKLDAAFAQAQRRNAEVNAAMGTSVSGGYAGTTAASTLGYLQQMQDMMADFQTRKTNLQLQFLDKQMGRDFQRELAERAEKQSYIQTLLDSNQEIPEGMWDEAGIGPEQKANMLAGGGAGGADAVTEGGTLKNEAGDLLMGTGGLGTSGEIQADPWAEDGESYQWAARQMYSGEGDDRVPTERQYYRIDENGNEVRFEPGVDGGRWPGDVRTRRIDKADIGPIGAWEAGRGSWTSHPDSGYDVPESTAIDYLDRMAARFGYDDHVEMFGQGATGHWKVDWVNAMQGSGAEVEYDSDGGYYRGDNLAVPAWLEIMQYISLFQARNDGMEPTDSEIFDHLRKSGDLPSGTPPTNPFTDMLEEEI